MDSLSTRPHQGSLLGRVLLLVPGGGIVLFDPDYWMDYKAVCTEEIVVSTVLEADHSLFHSHHTRSKMDVVRAEIGAKSLFDAFPY